MAKTQTTKSKAAKNSGSKKTAVKAAAKKASTASMKKNAASKTTANQPDEIKVRAKRDAFPDRIDTRDWFYQPTLKPLSDCLVNCDLVPVILNQGTEGACTGFALAAVINFQLHAQGLRQSVSPQMLYEMARRYDEWPGQDYDGSSARGAIKGWVAHGVCKYDSWKPADKARQFTQELAKEASKVPGGSYYRVMHKRVRDMHAALNETGIIYVTLMVHEGWENENLKHKTTIEYVNPSGHIQERILPVIQRTDPSTNEQRLEGHAVAIVGYTEKGFIIQNSWGEEWGSGGFALLPYEDYLLHATDVWVAQLGVPIDVAEPTRETQSSGGMQRASASISLSDIRPFIVDVGNNGELSDSGDYWTTEADLEHLITAEIPNRIKREAWQKPRIMLYLHGGLNDEKDVARRVMAFRDVFLANQIYPVHIMWESDWMASLKNMVQDYFTNVEERAGGIADWFGKIRDEFIEISDRRFELTAAVPGSALWNEMKENARRSSTRADDKGGMQLIAKYAEKTIEAFGGAGRLELHIVGHSAGSVFAAYALPLLMELGITIKTINFMAPAITVEAFRRLMLPHIGKKSPQPTLFVLSDKAELDDCVGPYRKSLLYLVSNAFEGERETPILGMERFISDKGKTKDKVEADMNLLFEKTNEDGLPSLVIAGQSSKDGCKSSSKTHGGFDNDADTLNSILYRILGAKPQRKFTGEELKY
jgi:hypothetical protein